jgi:EAL and modified HD-GYP domain-containing signal transduction protein
MNKTDQCPATPEPPLFNRQPIFGSEANVFAYGLTPEEKGDGLSGDDIAGARAHLSTFNGAGLDEIVGPRPAFITLTDAALYSGHCEKLPQSRVVLAASAGVTANDYAARTLGSFARSGFKLAIPDGSFLMLEGVADVITIDIRQMTRDGLKHRISELRTTKRKLLADSVETYQDFTRAKEAGFDLFQGQFFCKPEKLSQEIPANLRTGAQLLARLQDPDVDLNNLEEIISQDVGLSYQLLRFLNSAFVGLPREVDSIGHAARLVGIDRIRTWASLLTFAKMGGKPKELRTTAIVRAAMCERLAAALNIKPREIFFTVGLFSLLDALLDCSMTIILESLPLSPTVQKALLQSYGPAGEALSCVVAYEQGRWNQVRFGKLSRKAIRDCYLESLAWVRQLDGVGPA